MTMGTTILEIKNLSCQYPGTDTSALSNVSFKINSGEKVALLGNNGAGKSTLFLCCNGVLSPKSGEIHLHGKKMSRSKKDLTELRKAVGLVFQDPDHQIIASTVESEVSFGPMNLKLDKDTVAELTETAMAKMNLTALRIRPPHYLSGGEKKRVGIAGLLAMQPELLLMDEPTAGLDCAHMELFENTLEQLYNDGMSLIISTHDVDFAWRFAPRIIILSGGRVIADAPAFEVFSDDNLLKEAGLRKPVLFSIAEQMKMETFPKTLEEFKCLTKPC